jgi:N-acetylglucosaminyl-diphospho-decaprenol L-rhamnosyltransferase
MSRVDVSVVSVTYQCQALMLSCLAALDASVGGRSHEVIIVDNASTDDVVAAIRRDYPAVTVIEMGHNAGFARANNRGIAVASGEYILLLNPDTVPMPRALERLVEFLNETPRAAVAAPHLLNSDLTDQGTARSFPTAVAAIFGRRSLLTKIFPANRWSQRYLRGRALQATAPFEVDWVSGAAMLVRRDAIERVGGLDEGFFMHWEDADWCHRMKDAGYSVYCVPDARIIHHEGGSRRGWPPRQLLAFHQGAYRYYAKHHAPWWHPLRYVAAIGLAARAAALIAASTLAPHRQPIHGRAR